MLVDLCLLHHYNKKVLSNNQIGHDKKLKKLIIILSFFPAIAFSCGLKRNYNYTINVPMVRQLLEQLGISTFNSPNHIVNNKNLSTVFFLAANEPSPKRGIKTIIHRIESGPDIYNNIWSSLLLLESYLDNCSESFYRLLTSIQSKKPSFKKFGDIQSTIEFVKAGHLDESNLIEFREKFRVILEKYGLNTKPQKNIQTVVIKVHQIGKFDNRRHHFLKYDSSTANHIAYSFYTTDINNDDYYSFESLVQLVHLMNFELPIRFRQGTRFGWEGLIAQNFDPYNEYSLGKSIRFLTLIFIALYIIFNIKKIKDSWTKKA